MSTEQRERVPQQQEFVYKERLSNGLQVLVHEMPEARSVTARLLVKAGPRYEDKTTTGSAHYLEHVLSEGSKKYPTSREIDKAIEDRGGDYTAGTHSEYVMYQGKLPSEGAGFATEFLREVVFNPAMTKEAVKREKGIISAELGEQIDLPDQYRWDLLREHVWGGHPLARNTLGSFESIEQITLEDLLDYHNRFYKPNNAILVMAGKITTPRAIEMAHDFNDLSGSVDGSPVIPAPTQSVESRVLIEERDLHLAHILLAFGTKGHGESSLILPQIKVLSRMLRNRIFYKFVYDLGLSYSASCHPFLVSDNGNIVMVANVAPQNTEEAVVNMVHEVNHLKIDDASVEEAKLGVISNTFLNLADTDTLTGFIAEQELYTGNVKSPEEMEKEIQMVSAADIERMKKSLFTGENAVLVVLGPVSQDKSSSLDQKLLF